MSGITSGSGSSTSTYFCSEWTSCSLRSSGEIVSLGYLAQRHYRILVVVAVERDLRAGRDHSRPVAANRTRSNRLSTLSMQSSTVTRAMATPLLMMVYVDDFGVSYRLRAQSARSK